MTFYFPVSVPSRFVTEERNDEDLGKWTKMGSVQDELRHKVPPVGISTYVVYQGRVLQHSLHLAQRNILPSLKLHQVLLSIYGGGQNDIGPASK